jgi:hypothetical protein
VKNPAGLLARAIEQAYVVPEVPRAASFAPRSEPRPAVEAQAVAAPAATTIATPAVEAVAAGVPEQPDHAEHPLWTPLANALKERLSPATYAGWIAPARPLEADGTPEGAAADTPTRLTIVLPNAFTLERWYRPPIAPALQEACAAANIAVDLKVE